MFAKTPRVVAWQRAYCVLLAVIYALCVAGGVALVLVALHGDDPEDDAQETLVTGIVLIVVGIPLAAACLAGVFLPPNPWVWIYHLVLIALGMTSACFLPLCIPLLIFWVKPQTQAYFGRGPYGAQKSDLVADWEQSFE